MRRRLALSALSALFAASFAITGNVTTASADSSAPPKDPGEYSLHWENEINLGWNGPD